MGKFNLLEQRRTRLHTGYYSSRNERAYISWILSYILSHNKPEFSYSLRYSYAAYLLQNGNDIRTVQELSGHKDVHPVRYSL